MSKLCPRCMVQYNDEAAATCRYCGGPLISLQPRYLFSWELYPYSYPRLRIRARKSYLKIALVVMVLVTILALSPLLFYPRIWEVSGITDVDSLTGIVFDENMTPVSGAEILVNSTLMAVTSESGYFLVENVCYGSHKVQIRKEGFVTKNITIFVAEPIYTDIKVVLRHGTGFEDETISTKDNITAYVLACVILSTICAIFAMIGAAHCALAKNFGTAVVGAAMGMGASFVQIFLLGIFVVLAVPIMALSIAALFIILKNRYEFRVSLWSLRFSQSRRNSHPCVQQPKPGSEESEYGGIKNRK